jgi:hypothetical protein
MRLLAASFLVALLLLNTPAAAVFDDCSCAADDGSCSVSVSCPGGCISYCPSRGCRAKCIKNSPDGSGDPSIVPILNSPVNVQFNRSDSKQVAAELARITKQEVMFVPDKPGQKLSLDAKRSRLWDVLETLSEAGKLRVGGEDFSKFQTIRNALVSDEKMKVCIHNASVQSVVEEFAAMSGLPIHITSGDPTTLVTLTVKGVTLQDALAQVSSQTGVEIALR